MKTIGLILWSVTVTALAYLIWLAFIGTLSFDDCVLGCACAVVAAAASLLTWRAMGLSVKGRVRDFLPGWRVPWYILRDSWTVTWVLVLDLLGIRRAESLFRVCSFAAHHSAHGKLRRILTVLYSTATPNSIVLGIDPIQDKMVFHQLAPSGIPKTAQELGASE